MTNYLTVDDLRDHIGSDTTNFAGVAARVCTVASRTVEQMCERYFTQDSGVTVRYFDPYSHWECPVDDISTVTGLLVATDDAVDGTYGTSWTITTDFLLKPINQRRGGISGWPYECIQAVDTRSFTLNTRRPFVKVTAKWGWAAVPDNVTQAALLGAAYLFKMKDAADGFVGVDGWGPVRMKQNPAVHDLLLPFMKVPVATA